jgi:DNA helicase-2/ATP-dependent DNA helicase PcrA
LIGGMSFYDRKEVRDILAYLKLLANPADEVSLLRIINVPARGIGQTTVKQMMDEAIKRGKPLWEILPHAATLPGLSPVASQSVGRFQAMMTRFQQQMQKGSPLEVVKTLIRDIAYKNELVRQYPDAADQESRWASVEEVVNAVANYTERASKPTIAGFLQDIALNGNDADDDKESKLEKNAVALMTMHAAKGLEFPEVYIVGMEEGILPHHRSIGEPGADVDEERRLAYVGVTRAQRRLTLTLALSRRKWGRVAETIPSRFLYELTGKADNPNYLAVKEGKKRATRGRPTRR